MHAYDPKPPRRLYEVLMSQGMQANQQVTFLWDGGNTMRDLPMSLHPESEHVLDWLHGTLCLTVMGRMATRIATARRSRWPVSSRRCIKWSVGGW